MLWHWVCPADDCDALNDEPRRPRDGDLITCPACGCVAICTRINTDVTMLREVPEERPA